MKALKFTLPIIALMLLVSCSSVRVAADYDRQTNFNELKTYAFFKPGIDKAEISDLDKKRIMYAIDAEMAAKGFMKSENPDMLISIFTKEKERGDVYNNAGFGWGPYWGWGWGGYSNVTSHTEGSLYIDIIDAKKKELVWQGKGTGSLPETMDRKEERIREFVKQILSQYPPGSEK